LRLQKYPGAVKVNSLQTITETARNLYQNGSKKISKKAMRHPHRLFICSLLLPGRSLKEHVFPLCIDGVAGHRIEAHQAIVHELARVGVMFCRNQETDGRVWMAQFLLRFGQVEFRPLWWMLESFPCIGSLARTILPP